MNSPFIVGISGGSGSGKTFFIDRLVQQLPSNLVCQISQDNYYKNIDEVPVDDNGIKNFDRLEAVDFDKFIQNIEQLKIGKEVVIDEYTFNNKYKKPKQLILKPAPLIIVEGIFTFSYPHLQQIFDLKIFIDATDIVKIKRRIIRDAVERGYEMEDVLYRYEHHVEPSYRNHIDPHRHSADLVVPNSNDMSMAINLIAGFLNKKLKSK